MKETILDFTKQAEWRSYSDVYLKQAEWRSCSDVSLKQAVTIAQQCLSYTSSKQNLILLKDILA